ncbi:[protein-PII] uridylyltransferase [Facilibium subflavum]|uniref:[protein-PII] uridylyltransferase n=1 Tax=Facilibium subflavum TaxID=2219058 RepID=UPI0013C32496|nr:[protein-PII] uridylyltransferase [Facilibium subflavum]
MDTKQNLPAKLTQTDINTQKENIKQQFQQLCERLSQKFLKKKHAIYKILLLNNRYIDTLIQRFWPDIDVISVIAIGGYGRKERALFSDIDLLFLAADEQSFHTKSFFDYLDLLQSLPIKIGYLTQTLGHIMKQAQKDTHLLTALIDARFICGNHRIYKQLCQQLHNLKSPSAKEFLQQKHQEQIQRDKLYPINQQPDLKQTTGNLRYLHTVYWVFRYTYPNASIEQLVQKGYITPDELYQFKKAHRFLSAIRFYLHILHGRQENRMLLNIQDDIAQFFGEKDVSVNIRIEHFMQRYYQTIRHVKLINRIILSSLSQQLDPGAVATIDQQFYIKAGVLCNQDKNYPNELKHLLSPFKKLGQYKERLTLSADILRNIQKLVQQKSSKEIYKSSKVNKDFLDLLRQTHALKTIFSLLTDLGVLQSIIPEFSHAKGQMQFDLYHQYTVDRHTIELIHNLQEISQGKYQESFPLLHQCAQNHPAFWLIYIAGLFHDIGKGCGIDHAKYGARVVKSYADKWQLKSDETHLICWLVKHHLALSRSTKTQDIFDPEITQQFANFVHTQYYLDSLLILTVADIKATNTSLWSNWQQTLITNFYQNVSQVLKKHGRTSIKEQIISIQKKLSQNKAQSQKQRLQQIWQSLPARYFTEQSIESLQWQSDILIQSPDDRFNVFSRYHETLNQTMLIVIANTHQSPLCLITYLISEQGLNIHEASFFKINHHRMLYYFVITDLHYQSLKDPVTLNRITHKMQENLENNQQNFLCPIKKSREKAEQQRIKTQVEIHTPKGKSYTKIIIKTADRPGLLAELCYLFDTLQLQVVRARIHTAGTRVEDHFYVTDLKGDKIINRVKIQWLKHRLIKHLSQKSPKA